MEMDPEVFRTLQKISYMEPTVKRVAEFIDNGVLDKRIQEAVKHGVESCPFYIEGKAKKKINSVVKWVLTLCVPILVTILTLFASGVFAK